MTCYLNVPKLDEKAPIVHDYRFYLMVAFIFQNVLTTLIDLRQLNRYTDTEPGTQLKKLTKKEADGTTIPLISTKDFQES